MAAGLSSGVEAVRDRLRGSLWGLFIADALAAPTHWFYGGEPSVRRAYGGRLSGYIKPNFELAGSIMNKSNTGGAGRGSYGGDIIGTVINHGKKQYWAPGKSVHYHCTLEAGENTLEASLVRVLVRCITKNGGAFDADLFQKEYMDFMTMPGSHNDCYASTCHRMFFENRMNGVPPRQCPSNDGHNVDTIDGLVLPTAVALATISLPPAQAIDAIKACVGVTRHSAALNEFAAGWGQLLRSIVSGVPLIEAAQGACRESRALSCAAREVSTGRFNPVVA
uniref:Uncharacterized protein n=1 Tax=Coccolithus braarudii TaxID=221442 RepID=A0A7S0Q4S0_9EUKA|mmetsp:Transcript_35197/g.75162  ORF Transcript_35197/g.75162 Transcript_35197/m.75162 type:complete len:279 (+) Transcript_35197:31-867(+)